MDLCALCMHRATKQRAKLMIDWKALTTCIRATNSRRAEWTKPIASTEWRPPRLYIYASNHLLCTTMAQRVAVIENRLKAKAAATAASTSSTTIEHLGTHRTLNYSDHRIWWVCLAAMTVYTLFVVGIDVINVEQAYVSSAIQLASRWESERTPNKSCVICEVEQNLGAVWKEAYICIYRYIYMKQHA